jgi:cytidylate kinase
MSARIGLDQCRSFIKCHMQPSAGQAVAPLGTAWKHAVTISRQSGVGAHVITEKLAALLQENTPKGLCPWTVFDRNLIEQVLEDHQLPKHLAQFVPEDRVSEIDNIMDELFGVHPSMWKMVEHISDTILRLAELGNAIIIGRGANIITARLPHVVHVRIVSSIERRIANMQRFDGLTRDEATVRIQHEDRGRQRYVKEHFGKEVDNPLLYHLVLNTDLVEFDAAAGLIASLVLNRAPQA